ncbi:MAG TPA: hypothetical protein VFW31_09930, partial [Candidatus Angelobacter sp.]|nr:hypothetical protein [Candidatus Angelobacter sp.]
GNDGTATVTGIVLENNQGCRVDASCYLRLRVGSDEIRVIYHPGEGEGHVNKAAYQQGVSVAKGAHVEVYGRYSKRADVAMIETFSSDKFYIPVLAN